ncbi:MAG: alginate export family protein [bacterium]
MKNIYLRSAFLALTLITLSAGVQAQFNISAEVRMRGEYRDGYLTLLDSSKKASPDLLGRIRLLFDYKNEKIMTRFSLYDAWVFGQNSYSADTITKNTINVYEAWFKYNFIKEFGIKVGRTEILYDDERLFGNSNWSMWGATHDIIIAQAGFGKIGLTGDLGFAVNNVAPAPPYLNSYNVRNNYKYLTYLYLNKQFFDKKLSVSVLGIMDGFQKSSITTTKSTTKYDTLFVHDANDSIIGTTILPVITTKSTTEEFPNTLYVRGTVGAGATLNLKKWSFFLNGYYQFGHIKDGRKLNSNFYAAYIACQVVKPLKLMIGFEHLSGNNFSDTTLFKTTVRGFSTLYGTTHRGYGYMDMFTSLVKDNLSPGLNDLYGRATVSFTEKMSLELTYRWFSIPNGYLYSKSAKPGQLPYVEVKKSLGSEIDLMYVYKPIPNLELNAAYCFFLPTETMEIFDGLKAGTSRWAQYAYIMITWKPNFFSTEKK